MITTMAHSGRFDPRDFISAPYRTCPKCGHETFGILLIRDNRYTRRCRDCWHSSEYRLPELRRKIIYLDQFVISNLIKLVTPSAKGHEKERPMPFGKNCTICLSNCVTFNLSYWDTRCSGGAYPISTWSPPTGRCGSSPCCTMHGRCYSTSVNPGVLTLLHGRIAFSRSTPNTWVRGSFRKSARSLLPLPF
jgi:hypothetical protein